MAKVLFVIAQQNYRDEELANPKQVLEGDGYEVDVASTSTEIATGMLGGSFKPDLAVRDAKESKYDGIIIVGGSGAPELANHSEVIDLIKKFDENRKLVAAICIAPVVLAKAGVLEGRKATVWNSKAYRQSVRILEEHGARFTDQKICIDDNVITAFGPDYSHKFGEEVRDWLEDHS